METGDASCITASTLPTLEWLGHKTWCHCPTLSTESLMIGLLYSQTKQQLSRQGLRCNYVKRQSAVPGDIVIRSVMNIIWLQSRLQERGTWRGSTAKSQPRHLWALNTLITLITLNKRNNVWWWLIYKSFIFITFTPPPIAGSQWTRESIGKKSWIGYVNGKKKEEKRMVLYLFCALPLALQIWQLGLAIYRLDKIR